MIGTGTLVNAATVLLGAGIGLGIGHRLPERTRQVVTDGLGLVTLLIAASSAVAVSDDAFVAAVGGSAPILIVLGALLTGGIIGSLLRLEDRLEGLGDRLQQLGRGKEETEAPSLFIEGFVTSSLVFCVGPLTILGSITEGIGEGPDQLLLKAALDGFAAIAFAAAFGWGVFASIPTILVVQGALTALGMALGDFLPAAHLAALTATGGLLLVAVAMRLLALRPMPARIKVADLLPALVTAPLLTAVVVAFR
jgi:uncharacterized membrane protein YqgA involved in biofilm formation